MNKRKAKRKQRMGDWCRASHKNTVIYFKDNRSNFNKKKSFALRR